MREDKQQKEKRDKNKKQEVKEKNICSFSSNICTSKNQNGNSIFHCSRRYKN
jgi:hypothetical protein